MKTLRSDSVCCERSTIPSKLVFASCVSHTGLPLNMRNVCVLTYHSKGHYNQGHSEMCDMYSIQRVRIGCRRSRPYYVAYWRPGGSGCAHCHAWPQSYDHRPSHPSNAGAERVGFSTAMQTLLEPSAKRNVRCSASRMKVELYPTKNRL